ncbi:hypothetical protein NUACC26_094110 [Scytonema sp. NUACC26]
MENHLRLPPLVPPMDWGEMEIEEGSFAEGRGQKEQLDGDSNPNQL